MDSTSWPGGRGGPLGQFNFFANDFWRRTTVIPELQYVEEGKDCIRNCRNVRLVHVYRGISQDKT